MNPDADGLNRAGDAAAAVSRAATRSGDYAMGLAAAKASLALHDTAQKLRDADPA